MLGLRVINRNCIYGLKELSGCSQNYSQFPTYFKPPIFDKQEQKDLETSGELINYKLTPILPASSEARSSEFYDALSNKFVNYIMRHGQKKLARQLLENAFAEVKRIQVTKYLKADAETKDTIDLDPKVILRKAVENSCPVMSLKKIMRGGIAYQVPIPITAEKSKFLGMNWLIAAGKEKDSKARFSTKLAHELIEASQNRGRVVTRKKDLYKQCELNRAYAHYRWM